jgi:hypothetical protein
MLMLMYARAHQADSEVSLAIQAHADLEALFSARVGWGPIAVQVKMHVHGHGPLLSCHSSLHLPLPTPPKPTFTPTRKSGVPRIEICHKQ